MERTRYVWEHAGPVPTDPASPPRLWARWRSCWPDDRPFPKAIRWSPDTSGGGTLIVAFAPLPMWRGTVPPAPSSVKVFHVLEDGHPPRGRTDTRLPDVGIVTAFGEPVRRAPCAHLCEGVVRGLTLAAREPGAVIAFDHPAGWRALAESGDLMALERPAMLWPRRNAEERADALALAHVMRSRGTPVGVARGL